MPFDWRFRNFKRDPEPFLNGAVIDAENARNNLVQNAGNDMEGYTPLESTLAAQAMEGYKPVIPATQSQLAAGASQVMQGYIPNSAGRPSVPNDMHGGMGQPDLEGYGESLQAASDAAAQAQAKEQQIADIESQISALEKRITENTAKLKNWNSDDVVNKVAALEARKINSADPTSIWRWKVDRDEARRIAKMEKEKTKSTQQNNVKFEIDNTLSSITPRSDASSEEIQRDITKLYDLRTLAQKNEMPKSEIDKIDARIDLLRNPKSESSEETGEKKDIFDDMTNLNTPEKKNARVEQLLQHPEKTKPGDWAKVLKNPDGMNKDLVIKARAEYGKALDRQKATQDRNDMKADYKRRTGKDFDKADPYIQKKEQERWKRRNKK